jgi:heterodisulfide reductase subunit A
MSRGEAEIEATIARVNKDLCSGCLICVSMCPFSALTVKGKSVEVVEALCKGCGACSAACPSKAIEVKHFNDEQLLAELRGTFHSAG